MLNFSLSSIFASIVFGVSGLYIFRYGKREANLTLVGFGVALMTYTLFTKAAWQDWGFGIVLLAASYFFR